MACFRKFSGGIKKSKEIQLTGEDKRKKTNNAKHGNTLCEGVHRKKRKPTSEKIQWLRQEHEEFSKGQGR